MYILAVRTDVIIFVPVAESFNKQTSDSIDSPIGTANCILCFLAFFLSGLFGVKCICAVPYSTVIIEGKKMA